MTARASERLLLEGAAGRLEAVIDYPGPTAGSAREARGIALVAHPHPLYGGTLDNKVAQALARTFAELGYVALRPNFRGVGGSEGAHDEGRGETEDMAALARQARERYGDLPLVLAGFSFGAYVQTRAAKLLQPLRMVLVGLAVRRSGTENVPQDTIVIHGERDETIPLADVMQWALPQELPVVVVPGADHFFHRRLHVIRGIIQRAWRY